MVVGIIVFIILLILLKWKLLGILLLLSSVGLIIYFYKNRADLKEKSKIYKFGVGFLTLMLVSQGTSLIFPSESPKELETEIVQNNYEKPKSEKENINSEDKIDSEVTTQTTQESESQNTSLEKENHEVSKETESNNINNSENLTESNKSAEEKVLTENEVTENKVAENTEHKEYVPDPVPEPLTSEEYVYITPTGSKYHRRKCGKGNFSETTLDNAEARGLIPCKRCY